MNPEKVAEIVLSIESDMKISTTGAVVQSFRKRNNLDSLKVAIPYLSKGNRIAISEALSGGLSTCKRCYS